ncbi:MAG: CapA family protein [Anaerolineaceae bacterium]|nr:CapA family protein [Anaerolineaceae bacterium]
MKKNRVWLLWILILSLTACTPQEILTTQNTEIDSGGSINSRMTSTPFKPFAEDVAQKSDIKLWIPEYLSGIQILWNDDSKLVLGLNEKDSDCSFYPGNVGEIVGNFIFAFVVPFNTVQDEITIEQLKKILLRDFTDQPLDEKIYLSKSTHALLSETLGDLSDHVITVVEDEIFSSTNQSAGDYGLVPFDQLEPKWKVIRIENISPFDKNFNEENYYFNFPIRLHCSQSEFSHLIMENLVEKLSTRRADKVTTVLLTGTTALTRATADRMEKYGNLYPGENIKLWFENSDIRHISSETPFYENCPPPNPIQKNLVFCSHPKYAELFSFLPVDVIELTGNHLLDKGVEPFENTLSLLTQLNLLYYAGGFSDEEAEQPALLEHNGNKIAFLGCNIAGPSNVWATETRSGVNACDFSELTAQIHTLKEEGYLPIVTFQYYESNSMRPTQTQMNDFRRMVDAGAVIVSGSQSHVPMSMEVYHDAFVHYGLGNLFFDQMDSMSNRREFLDRHIFYDGRLIGTELLTAMLENYAQPRPMTNGERESLLQDAFKNFALVGEE